MRAQHTSFTTRQLQIILGGLMGDGSLIRKWPGGAPYYAESHTEPQVEYITWKAAELASLNSRLNHWTPPGRNRQWYLTTRKDYAFDDLFERFYQSGHKTLPPLALSLLDTLGLAVWFMDDGSFNARQRYLTVCTDCWPLRIQHELSDWFSERWGVRPVPQFRKDKGLYRLRFRQNDSLSILRLVEPHILPLFRAKWHLDDADTFRPVLTKGETLKLARQRRKQLIREGVLTVGYHTGTVRVVQEHL